MTNPNASADNGAFNGNAAAPVHPAMAPALGSITGPASLPVHDTTRTPFAGGPLADVGGAFAQGSVQPIR
jgi:hypothetical protein